MITIQKFKSKNPISFDLQKDLNDLYKKHSKEIDAWQEWIQLKSIRKVKLTKTNSIRIERYFDSGEIFDIMRQDVVEMNRNKVHEKLKVVRKTNPKIKKGYQ